ncbi:MAG: 4'-phosphopantetheinyl transferase superfamily protein [Acidobacteria bacterium]|nr:4'-phosphopantetheinyl transferase superfamily protein [Acidobacteriota bacterium]
MMPALPTLDALDTTVHVVLAAHDAPEVSAALPSLRAVLSAQENVREQRYRMPGDRERFVVGRGLARHLLGQALALSPSAVAFALEPHGRPTLASGHRRDLGFTVSHTPGLVAVAISATRELGIDVEDTARVITQDIPNRFFAPDEVRELHAQPPDRQVSVFFDFWTLKEAYIKARGLGLSIPLDQFSFHLDPHQPPVLTLDPRQPDTAAHWQFFLASPTARHRLALAVRGHRVKTQSLRLWWFGVPPA